ncbi:MAG: hypothetical protein RLN99_00345 [Kiloniellaceae bacterium]
MTEKKNLAQILAVTLLLPLFPGCAETGGGGWPVQTYPDACHTGMIPFEPFCLSSASIGEGFKYRDEFQACRESMSNFIRALDTHYDCTERNLQRVFDGLLKSVPDTFNCYVEFFIVEEEGDPSSACPPVEVPHILRSYEADGLEISLGVPRCIRRDAGYNFAPKRAYELEMCHEQVEVFTGKKRSTYRLDAAPAQEQYDTYLRNLRQVLDRKADDAIRQFNCMAEGGSYCF